MAKQVSILTAAISLIWGAWGEPAFATDRPLPDGYKWGRCILQVDGKAYIKGRCVYQVEADGTFQISGPRQIYSGIDYIPEADGTNGGERSNDYVALVHVEGASAEGFWNEEPEASHVQGRLGTLQKRGACWINKRARICLWRN